jgi:hypothetical protein
MAFVENLSVFFEDFGVTVVAGALTTLAIFDMPDENVLGDRVQSTEYTIVFPTGALGTLEYGSAVTVSGVAYKVRQVHQIEDGALQRATLEALTAVVN